MDSLLEIVGGIAVAPFICLGWIIAGFIAGALAHRITNNEAPFFVDILLGLVGSVVGNVVLSLLNIYRESGGLVGFIVSILVGTLGGVIIIGVLRLLRGQPLIARR